MVVNLDNSHSMLTSKDVHVEVRQGADTPAVWLSRDPADTARPLPEDTPAHLHHILARLDRDMAHTSIYDAAAMNEIVLRTCYLFFTNRFEWAESTVRRHFRRSPIFSLAFTTINVMVAVLSWNEADIAESRARAAHTLALASAMQPDSSWFSGGASAPTPSQVEGYVVGAEVSLINAFLHILEESMLSLAKCGLAVHSGLKLYGQVDSALGKAVSSLTAPDGVPAMVIPDRGFRRAAVEVDEAAAQAAGVASSMAVPAAMQGEEGDNGSLAGMPPALVSGGLFGMGMFNLITGSMPDIALKVVQFLGYSASKQAALAQLRACMLGRSVRGPLAGLGMLIELVQLPSFLSDAALRQRCAVDAEEVLGVMFRQFPNSALFLWNAGRAERMRWNLGLADALFAECAAIASSSAKFQALANVAAYDRAFCYLFLAPGGNELAQELLTPPATAPDFLAVTPVAQRLAAAGSTEGDGDAAAAQEASPANRLASGHCRSCWHLALQQLEGLQDGSLWSKAFFSYMTAVCLAEDAEEAAAAPRFASVAEQMGRKLGGKSISAEQFVMRKVQAYSAARTAGAPVYKSQLPRPGVQACDGSPRYLLLPGLEVVYLFNGFSCMDPRVARDAVLAVDDALLQLSALEPPVPAPSATASSPAARPRHFLSLSADHETVTAFLDAVYTGVPAAHLHPHLRTEGMEVGLGGATPPAPPTETPSTPTAPALDVSAVLTKRRKNTAPGSGGGLAFWRRSGDTGAAAQAGSIPHPTAETRTHPSGALRADLVAVGALLRGAALNAAGCPTQALACFQWVREHKEQVQADNYTVPFAYYEMATILGKAHPEGPAMLKRAKDYGKDFNFKMRLHLRLHLLGQAWKGSAAEAQEGAAAAAQ